MANLVIPKVSCYIGISKFSMILVIGRIATADCILPTSDSLCSTISEEPDTNYSLISLQSYVLYFIISYYSVLKMSV